MTSTYPATAADRERPSRALSSARVTLGILWRYYAPQSVIDVGCGAGAWMKAAAELGAERVQGLDGAGVTKEQAVVPFDQIRPLDLGQPFSLPETFDLAICVEAAGRLRPSRSVGFIKDLAKLARVVVFSAAAPCQDDGRHINAQWPEHWAALFRQEGYVALDFLRSQLWNNPEVDWWHAQNAILYVKEDHFLDLPSFQELRHHQVVRPLSLVHPALLEEAQQPTLQEACFKILPRSLWRAVSSRRER
ncbi:MAG: class I SAM-dependent methyltransferase [Verrucomicrobiota bacterium]